MLDYTLQSEGKFSVHAGPRMVLRTKFVFSECILKESGSYFCRLGKLLGRWGYGWLEAAETMVYALKRVTKSHSVQDENYNLGKINLSLKVDRRITSKLLPC